MPEYKRMLHVLYRPTVVKMFREGIYYEWRLTINDGSLAWDKVSAPIP